MCGRVTAALVTLRLVGAADRRAFQDFPETEAARLLEAGIQERILVLDPGTGELRGGAAGLVWKLGETRLAPLARVLGRPPLLAVLDAAYRFIASNRRFVSAPAPGQPVCACDPPDRPRDQLAFLLFAAALASGCLIAVGAAAPAGLGLADSRAGVLEPLLRAGGPWAIPALCARVLAPGDARRYLVHLAATAAVGGLAFLPLALAGLTASRSVDPVFPELLLVSCVAAGAVMTAMQRRRLSFQRRGRPWLLGWAACAALGLSLLAWPVLQS